MTIAEAAQLTMESHLAKSYDPRLVEAGVYDRWDDAGYFQPRERPDREDCPEKNRDASAETTGAQL